MHKWNEDRWGGVLLILAATTGVVVMAHHPSVHGIRSAGDPAAAARFNRFIHGLAIAALPVQFLGLLGLSRRLEESLLNRAGLVAQGFGLIAGMAAAVASGFVATRILLDGLPAGPSAEPSPLLGYTAAWNQGFAAIYVVATAISLLLWSLAILRGRALSRAPGVFGILVALGVLAWQALSQQHLGTHQFGAIVLAQAAWLIWIGVLLMAPRRSGTVPPPASGPETGHS